MRGIKRWALFLAVFWVAALTCACFASGLPALGLSGEKPLLGAEERAYIAAHPEVTIALDTSWIPYAMTGPQSGEVMGVIPRILGLVCRQVGLKPLPVSSPSYMDAIKTVQSGGAMLLSGIADDRAMVEKNGVLATRPYITINYSMVTSDEIDDLYRPGAAYRVAVCVGSYSTMAMKKKMPSYRFVEYQSNAQCMEAVRSGGADMALIAAYAAEYYKAQHRYRDLHSVLISSFTWGLCFGVNKDCDPALIRLLNAGIASLSESDVNQAIYGSLIEAIDRGRTLADYVYDWPVASMAALCLFLALLLSLLFLLLRQRLRNRELERERRLNSELTKANEVTQKFLARMSHELRTPMNVILGLITLALDLPGRSREMTAYIEQARDAGKHLLRIINDILDAHAAEDGCVKLETVWRQPAPVFASALEMLAPEFAKKGVRFLAERDDAFEKGLEYELDPLRCVQIVENLLGNALKFTPPGGTAVFRHERLRRDGDRVWERFSVSDTGCGMSEDFQKRMFTPFAQDGCPDQAFAGGMGLGLSLVRRIVDSMKGTLEVESAENRGTRIAVTLPFRWRHGEPPAAAPPPGDDLLKGRRVLVAEDNPMNAMILEKLLERRGMAAQVAKDGLIALDAFSAAPPGFFDAVLMDIRMPRMDGLESARAIRSLDRPDAKSVPIIAVTANAYESDKEDSRNAGMDEHLAKPIDVAKLYAALQRLFLEGRPHE